MLFVTSTLIVFILFSTAIVLNLLAKNKVRAFAFAASGAVLIAALFAIFGAVQVPSSHVSVVTSFGEVTGETLNEGGHLISPLKSTNDVFTGIDTVVADNASAASADLQTVHSTLKINIKVTNPEGLYRLNPALNYVEALIKPASYEVFKDVVANHSAEELVTKRSAISAEVLRKLQVKFAKYFVVATDVNLVDFGFSKAFDEAIEAKVTAKQEAETAINQKETVKAKAESKLIEARADAEATRLKAEAASRNGGESYAKLEAIKKWDGKLPTYIGGSGPVPILDLSK